MFLHSNRPVGSYCKKKKKSAIRIYKILTQKGCLKSDYKDYKEGISLDVIRKRQKAILCQECDERLLFKKLALGALNKSEDYQLCPYISSKERLHLKKKNTFKTFIMPYRDPLNKYSVIITHLCF